MQCNASLVLEILADYCAGYLAQNKKRVRISLFFTTHFPNRNGTIGILNIVTPRNGTHGVFFLSTAWLAVNGNIFVGTRVRVIVYQAPTWVAPTQLRLSIGRSVSGENWK